MIQANELRVGNIVYFQEGSFMVSGINQVFNDEPYEISLKDSDGMFQDVGIEDISPVPLSDKLMLDFGFHHSGAGYFHKDSLNFCLSRGELTLYLETSNGVGTNFDEIGEPIFYVHQFQNLFFALKGKELATK